MNIFFIKIINSAGKHSKRFAVNFTIIMLLLNCVTFPLIINKILQFKFSITKSLYGL